MGLFDWLETRAKERTKRKQSKHQSKVDKRKSKDTRKTEIAADKLDERRYRQENRQATGNTAGDHLQAVTGQVLSTAEALAPELIPLLAGQPSAELAQAHEEEKKTDAQSMQAAEEWDTPTLIGIGAGLVGLVLGGVALAASLASGGR